MDPTRFDALTKRLATGGTSRRRVLTGIGGALGAALLGSSRAGADNTCKPSATLPQSRCNKNAQCCSGVCSQGTCCTPVTTCTPDQCGTTISDGCGGMLVCPACPPTCAAGTCTAGGSACTGQHTGCSTTNPGCLCQTNTEGETVCANLAVDCRNFPQCTSSADCPAGHSCFDVFCGCGGNFCLPCCAG